MGLVPSLYQGQYLDTETGIAYNRFRYYSPETGAYISQDPIRLEAGLTNLYAYVLDVNAWVDPWGLKGIIPTILLGSNNEILEATATINKMDLGGGSATNRSSRSYARSLGNIDDAAGHIIGDHCTSTPLHNLHFPLRNSGVFRLRRGRGRHPTSQPKDPDFRGEKVEAVKRWTCAMVSYLLSPSPMASI